MSERTNDRTENIGARRLHTVMERLLDEISFDAPEMGGREVVIDADYVRERLNPILQDQDLSRYVWWVDFGEPEGSKPGYRRPALVLQRDEVNASRIDTVVVCVLTNRSLANVPGNMLLPRRATGLPRDSVANASQIATVNKEDLDALAGTVPPRVLDRVNEGLRWFLGLDA